MQFIWLVHTVLPRVCMYNKPNWPFGPFGQYVQPNGLLELYDVSVAVVSFKFRYVAAASHSAVSVMSSREGQTPDVIEYGGTYPSGVGP